MLLSEENKERIALTLGFTRRPHTIRPILIWRTPNGLDVGTYLPLDVVEKWIAVTAQDTPTLH
jgi:hypothetical protein